MASVGASVGEPEYLADERPRPEAIAAVLDGAFRLRAAQPSVRELTFYDTFDGRLRQAGIELALTDGEPVPDAAHRAAEGRALLALARVRIDFETIAVLDDLDKTVLRIELLSPAGLAPRIRLRALRGYEQEFAEVVARLDLRAAERSLRDEAILAAGGRPAGISAKVAVALDPDDRADAATVTVLTALWEVIEANLEGTLADTDSEFLHDYRVSMRKTRAVLKECKGVFAPASLAHWREEWKWLQQVTGDTRDLDVYIEDFDDLAAMVAEADSAALAPLRSVLGHRRATARRLMVRELRSERAHALASGWAGLLAGLTREPLEARPDAAVSIDTLASRQIATVYRRMLKLGSAIDADSPAEDYHDLRKQGKELRYLLELFGTALHDTAVVKPMVKALKDLQDVLGRHQDREIQGATVRGLADEVVGLPGGPAALIAMGALVRALGADERAARGEFARAFAAFSAKDQRALVKATFGRS
jgi:CHAD domain-containing protein